MGTLGSGRYAPYAQRPHGRFVHHVEGQKPPYAFSLRYSASKAVADHLVRAWHKTYDLPIVVSKYSNKYGHYQFPEN